MLKGDVWGGDVFILTDLDAIPIYCAVVLKVVGVLIFRGALGDLDGHSRDSSLLCLSN